MNGMINNLAWGTALIALTVFIQTLGLMALSYSMPKIIEWLRLHRHHAGQTVALVTTVIGLFFIHTVEVWSWAILYNALGAIRSFEDALYLSTQTFSTVGTGAVSLNPAWRLLTSLEGIDGFILIGWSIAYLVAASTHFGPFREDGPFSSATRRHFASPPILCPVSRASLIDPSMASVPLFEKKARSSPESEHSFSASGPWYS